MVRKYNNKKTPVKGPELRTGRETMLSRRRLLSMGVSAGAASAFGSYVRPSYAQSGALRIGVLLPFSGTYAPLGEAIMHSLELYTNLHGGKLAGRDISFVKVEDYSAPPTAP